MRDPTTIDSSQSAVDFAYTILCDMGMLGWMHWTAEDKNDEFRADRGRYANHHRDFAIAIAVFFIVRERGLNPTRNRANHKQRESQSACAIVTAALQRGYILIDETAVEKIWQKRKTLRAAGQFFSSK